MRRDGVQEGDLTHMAENRPKRNPKAPRQLLPVLEPARRAATSEEVALGFHSDQVRTEALRCLYCKDPKCVDACPLHIDIKAFIACIVEDDYAAAFRKISEQSPFPGVCGRVCQHELFCESACLLGKKLDPVAIGSLERFAADWQQARRNGNEKWRQPNGPKVALVGSGPASLIAAFDLVRNNYRVTVFEALHELGGVLAYGIPPFRLPRDILYGEIARLRLMGVEFVTDFIVGRTATVEELFEEGFQAIFIGTGAGLPWMLNIPGENLIGVYTANEFLTRVNLMNAHRFPESDTPVRVGARTVVVGGGNSAMDAARWARRLGSETTILFRRGRAELKARLEEIEHAGEEGVHFEFLAAPVRLIGDEKGYLREMECIRMELGPPDSSGRPAPIPIPGSEYRIPADTVVAAIGQAPNPTLQRATPQLLTNKGKIVIDATGKTSMDRVYAGGDVVRGGATVILAMRDGRAAAEAIHKALIGEAEKGAGMNRIASKRQLTPEIALFEVEAPRIARRWKAGNFIIVRPTGESERIPLTIVAGDAARGTIQMAIQAIGKTTRVAAALEEGQQFADVVGPLGEAASVEKVGRVLCVGGGVGVAELLPVAAAFRKAGNRVTAICGARTIAHRILDDELRGAADELLWSTDDGSFGFHGNVVQYMREWIRTQPAKPDAAHVIGPIPMMRAAADLTREWGVKTYASLNPVMIDGTGMCGGCRVTVADKVRFACVEGPEFDAHQVDFEELARRNRAYVEQEREALNRHQCKLGQTRQ